MSITTANPLYRTQKLIANTGAFRGWCGIDSSLSEQEQYDAAKARIHIHMAEKNATRPFALVQWGETRTYNRQGMGFILTADVDIAFINDFPAETADNIQDFDDNVASVIQEMGDLSNTDDHIDFDEIAWQGYTVMEVEQGTDVIWSGWNCSGPNWGVSEV